MARSGESLRSVAAAAAAAASTHDAVAGSRVSLCVTCQRAGRRRSRSRIQAECSARVMMHLANSSIKYLI